MKMLLDENLPKLLKLDFPEHTVFTVRDMNWQSKTNGTLLRLMLADGFEVLMTFDKNLRHQQNFQTYPLAVLVLDAPKNKYEVLKALVPEVRRVLAGPLPAGATILRMPPASAPA